VEERRLINASDDPRATSRDGAATRPAGICDGPGHVVVYGNQAFRVVFGAGCVGLPAREGLVGLPAAGFAVLDAVLGNGRAGARWIRMDGRDWRMTAAPRRDPATGEVYGVAFHLRERDDLPVVADPGH
jgi:hypothetical protein